MDNNIFDGSDLFVDEEIAPETPEETTEPETTEPTEPEQPESTEKADQATEPEADKPGVIRVKYKGEERELSVEDAVVYAQKGMNYDVIYNELQTAKAEAQEIAPFLQEVDYWAKESGMNRSEYLSFLRENRQTQMLQNEMSDIKAQYPDLPDEVVKEMAELRCKGKEAENVRLEEQQAQAQKDAELAPWQKFIEVYGITDPEKIPPDVMADVGNGLSPVEAMQKHEINELKKQLEAANTKKQIEEKHEENKRRAMPSAATQAQPEKEDSFLAGMGF